MNKTEQEAYRLFRIVHGKGDGGSVNAFNALNPDIHAGWLRLAKNTLAKVRKAGEPIYGPRSMDC